MRVFVSVLKLSKIIHNMCVGTEDDLDHLPFVPFYFYFHILF